MRSFIVILLFIPTLTIAGPGHNHNHSKDKKKKQDQSQSHGHAHGHGHSHGHHGHSHAAPSISRAEAKEIGKKEIKRLIGQKKLDASWSEAKHQSSQLKKFNGQNEIVMTFKNNNGKKGTLLYMFISTKGKFIAANFTGK